MWCPIVNRAKRLPSELGASAEPTDVAIRRQSEVIGQVDPVARREHRIRPARRALLDDAWQQPRIERELGVRLPNSDAGADQEAPVRRLDEPVQAQNLADGGVDPRLAALIRTSGANLARLLLASRKTQITP